MLLHTLLNFVTAYKSFVFKNVWLDKENPVNVWIGAEIEPRKNSPGVCPECGRKCPTYDTASEPRWFEFVPIWNIPVWFAYASNNSLQITLYHALGKLPKPNFTHKFW